MARKLFFSLWLLILIFSTLAPQPAFALRSGQFKWRGIIESLPAGSLVGDWIVSGYTVHVFNTTFINQEVPAALGRLVEVKGYFQSDGSINAFQIKVKGEKFYGMVEALPVSGLIGDWTVG
ncbi:MAG: DUF5666 domain-containing protein, partial [Anaerolineales bacterium]